LGNLYLFDVNRLPISILKGSPVAFGGITVVHVDDTMSFRAVIAILAVSLRKWWALCG
jgi:hypothetical protein